MICSSCGWRFAGKHAFARHQRRDGTCLKPIQFPSRGLEYRRGRYICQHSLYYDPALVTARHKAAA